MGSFCVPYVLRLNSMNHFPRILNEVNLEGFEKQEIKNHPITAAQLEEMHALSKSYEALFNKRAKLYKEMDLKNQKLTGEREFLAITPRVICLISVAK